MIEELIKLRTENERLRQQAAGQCDGCGGDFGEHGGDAFCWACLDKLQKRIAQALDVADWMLHRCDYGPPCGRCAWCVASSRVSEALALLGDGAPERTLRPRIVCLCGSTRFVPQMAIIQWVLERDQGVIALGLHWLPPEYDGPDAAPDHMAEAAGKKEHFDELHKRKIDLADEVLVINVDGYIGESTRSEIEYAKAHGKPVRYWEAPA